MKVCGILKTTFAFAVVLYLAGPARAQVYRGLDRNVLTYPKMNVVTSVENGWIVAYGQTLGGTSNRILWRTPVAPAQGSVSVDHGPGATSFEIGGRYYVLDNATGQSMELTEGQVGWQPYPYGPLVRRNVQDSNTSEGPAYLPPGTAQEAQPSPGYQAYTGVYGQQPYPPANQRAYPPQQAYPPAQAYVPRRTGTVAQPWQYGYDRQPTAVDQLSRANQNLEAAMARLDELSRLQQQAQQAPAMMTDARRQVESARTQVQYWQDQVLRRSQAQAQPAAADQPTPEQQQMQSQWMNLLAQYSRLRGELERLGNDQPVLRSQLVRDMDVVAGQILQIEQQREKDRMTEGLPPADRVPPELRNPLRQSMQNVLDLLAARRQAQERLDRVRQAYNSGLAGANEVASAENSLTDIVSRLAGARQNVTQLRVQIMRQQAAQGG